MKKIIAFTALAVTSVTSIFLQGCTNHEGDSSDTVTTTIAPQGLWVGTTNMNRTVTGLILSNGTFYFIYSAAGNPAYPSGVIQGSGHAAGNSFSSTNAKDFNLEGQGIIPATVSANFAYKQNLNGTVTYSYGGSTAFTSTYNTNYEKHPSLLDLSGAFTGQVALSAGIQSAVIRINDNGIISSNSNGCVLSGTVTPRSDGNAYNLSVSFGASPCYFANQTFSGIAYFDVATKRLYAAAPNTDRTDGFLFVGTKY